MSDEQEIELWERRDAEPMRWYARFLLYRDMGPGRSLLGAVKAEEAQKSPKKPSAAPPGAWKDACKQWEWRQRAEAWDTFLDKQREQQIVAERKKVLSEGFALMHKRIEALSVVGRQLEGYMQNEEKVWLPDAKIVATGMGLSERVDLVVFNSDLFREYRECLTDIAEEMGERVSKSDVNVSSTLVVREVPHGYLGEPLKHD